MKLQHFARFLISFRQQLFVLFGHSWEIGVGVVLFFPPAHIKLEETV